MNTNDIKLYTWYFSLGNSYTEVSAYGRNEKEARSLLTKTITNDLKKAKDAITELDIEIKKVNATTFTKKRKEQLEYLCAERYRICDTIGYLFQGPYSPDVMDFALDTETDCGETVEAILAGPPIKVGPFASIIMANTQTV